MKKIALSVFKNQISSRLDSANNVLLLTIDNEQIKESRRIKFITGNPLEKMQKIIQLDPDVLICGGITNLCDTKLKESRIKVIPWVKGNTADIVHQFLEGKL